MDYSILIPTCKSREEIAPYIKKVKDSVSENTSIIVSCLNVSAATNRNYCLSKCKTEYAVMIDDDLDKFFYNWTDKLLEPFRYLKDVALTSARLMHDKNKFGLMMDIKRDGAATWQVIDNRFMPSACIAFKNDGCRFDENFIGSSWEDTDFCVTLQKKYPYGLFIVNDEVRIVHLNDMKNGDPEVYQINKTYFEQKHRGSL